MGVVNRWCGWLVVVVLLVLPLSSNAANTSAADSSTIPYTLSQAFRDTLSRDPRIQAANSRIGQARESLEEANSGYRPQISLTGSSGYDYNRSEARTISDYKGLSLRGGISAQQSLYSFGRLGARTRRAEAVVAEAEYAAEGIRQKVLAEVARSFVEQLFRQRILQQRRDFVMLVGKLEHSAHERIAIGALDRTQLLQILHRLHRARAQRIEADSLYRIARTRLARLTGADHDQLVVASVTLIKTTIPAGLDDALRLAERMSLVVAQARQRLKAAEEELIFRQAELMPVISFEVNASIAKVGNINTLDVGGSVNLFVPLYEGGLNRSQQRNARLAVETAQQELVSAQEQMVIEIRSQWDLVAGLAKAAQDFEEALGDSQQLVELTKSKLDEHRATFVEYIEAQQFSLGAEFDALDNQLRLETTRIDLVSMLASLKP